MQRLQRRLVQLARLHLIDRSHVKAPLRAGPSRIPGHDPPTSARRLCLVDDPVPDTRRTALDDCVTHELGAVMASMLWMTRDRPGRVGGKSAGLAVAAAARRLPVDDVVEDCTMGVIPGASLYYGHVPHFDKPEPSPVEIPPGTGRRTSPGGRARTRPGVRARSCRSRTCRLPRASRRGVPVSSRKSSPVPGVHVGAQPGERPIPVEFALPLLVVVVGVALCRYDDGRRQ